MVSFAIGMKPKEGIECGEYQSIEAFEELIRKGLKSNGIQMSFLGKRNMNRLWNEDKQESWIVLGLEITFPGFFWFALPILVPMLLFQVPLWAYIFPCLIFATGILWTPLYWFALAKIRLRKLGFNGKVRLVWSDEALTEVLDHWAK